MARNRIIYASNSVIADGVFLYRVQTLGSSSTFNSEDIFELGQLAILDVVDDVPTVAVTVDTNDWGSIHTVAALAGVPPTNFHLSATSGNANLTVNSGTGVEVSYYHGVALSDYGLDTAKINLWAPVQTESALGTSDDLIDQTLFLRSCYVNNIEWSYSTGANGTENYGLETDNKLWLLNAARFVTQEEWDLTTTSGSVELSLEDGVDAIPTLSDQKLGFLIRDANGDPGISIFDASAGTWGTYRVTTGAATATTAGYNAATHVISLPTGTTWVATDKVRVVYCANAYADAAHVSGGCPSTRLSAKYFVGAPTFRNVAGSAPEALGAVRQGQIEIFMVDPDLLPSDYSLALRLTSASLTASLGRETLTELGHLKPYYRTLTFPVEITTSIETTAGDLETYAKFAGRYDEFLATTMVDISIDDIINKNNMVLVVMVYEQTNEEAGGSYSSRIIKAGSPLIGKEYFVEGQKYVYAALDREYPVKTLVIPGLKATSENYNLAVGSNASQSFEFRSTNKLFCVQGFVPIKHVLASPGFEKNS